MSKPEDSSTELGRHARLRQREPKHYKGFRSKADFRRAERKLARLERQAGSPKRENLGPRPRTEVSPSEHAWLHSVLVRSKAGAFAHKRCHLDPDA